ncbi:MAG: primosomal protein N' [Magnetococcales bacterium]|nr:primosomal protein N' [Magnetococcales bacterium]
MRFAQVALPIPRRTLFTYEIPDAMTVEAGSLVLVPVGKREQAGIVWEIRETPAWNQGPIARIIAPFADMPMLGGDLLHLLDWIARYYLCPIGSVTAAALPGELSFQRKRRALWLGSPEELAALPESLHPLALRLAQTKAKGLGEETLGREFGLKEVNTRLRNLEKRGLIRIDTSWNARLPTTGQPITSSTPFVPQSRPELTDEQHHAVDRLTQALEQHAFAPFLLEGITGSGKTEVYLRAIEACLQRGRQALVLVPEIALTSQMIERLSARFPDSLAVLHSGLSRSQRPREWWRARLGEARVVIGARSALFAPFMDLGLVIVDEEHDPSYKQDGTVPYQARDMAAVRAQKNQAILLLGSATPSMESLANAQRGRYTHLRLTRRVGGGVLPSIEAVHLGDPAIRAVLGRDGLLSPPLCAAMTQTLQAGRQVLLFLNRRGFAPSLLCHRCGQAIQCPHCSVTLTLHKNRSRLLCHYCDFTREPMDVCPSCGQLSLFHFGPGTQRLEEECRTHFPQARIARLDRDTVSSGRHTLEETLTAFTRHNLDILVGTQMIAKGHHFPGLSLVGVVQAETSLCQPDFRASERTFQLLTQVTGRAGREDQQGRAIIQTFDPHHYAVAAALGVVGDFTLREMAFRHQAGYPPSQRLALLRFSAAVQPEGEIYCQTVQSRLAENPDAIFLGPAPAPLFKLRNRYRWQLLIKERPGGRLHRALPGVLALAQSLASSRIRLELDVDPYTFL